MSALVTALRAAGCVFAEEEAALLTAHASTPQELSRLLAQRVDGVPLEHVLGWTSFCGLRIAVTPGVFVPRSRSELLVTEALSRVAPGAVVVDLCCGSGAVGAAILATRPDVVLHATDLDPTALACARLNVEQRGGHVHHGDLFDPLPEALLERVSVVVANAPYVPTDHLALLPPEARLHEPRAALDGGPDGLDVLRRIAAEAAPWLRPEATMLIETSAAQAAGAAALLVDNGFAFELVRDDERDATVAIGVRRA